MSYKLNATTTTNVTFSGTATFSGSSVTLPSNTSIGTVSSTEIGYLDGVTSAIQTQLGNKQALDADLTAIAALGATAGVLKKTAADTWEINTGYATLASPTFTGTPAAPTAVGGTNTTQIATTAYVRGEISSLIDAAPGALDTLNELAAAINDDANFFSTINTAIGNKQPLDADLTAIAALAGTSGLLKKTAADTWTLDTATYLTTNATITLSGDVTGSGTTAITTTLATVNSNVGSFGTASSTGTFTVNAKGLVTAASSTAIALAGSAITSGTVGATYIDSAIARLASPSFTGAITTQGRKRAYVAKTALYTLTATDDVVNGTSGTWTATLPTAVGVTGTEYTVKNTGAGVITVGTTSAQTIDGSTTQTLGQYESITVVSDGANWIVV